VRDKACVAINFNLNFKSMRTVTMLEFRKNAERVLRRVAKGERLVLSHRGKAAARLEPMTAAPGTALADDPFLRIGRRATASPKGKTKHAEIDRILYGGR
jgi:antitoxin (DNA-binding transcriptional repressor) of toxin-antitoxin stability system